MRLTAKRLKGLLNYDPDTGVFIWAARISQRTRIGTVAGRADKERYREIKIKKKGYFAHRLAWLYVHGEWPPQYLDHINGDITDNRIANLRLATNSQNQANSRKHRDNKSGYKGVCFFKRIGRWKSYITKDGKVFHLGYFDTPEEAHAAYVAAAKRLHGEFARAA